MKKIKKYIEDNKYTLIFIFLLFALSLFMSSLFQKESDYFWHISAGKYMFDNKLILTKDVFSWFLNHTLQRLIHRYNTAYHLSPRKRWHILRRYQSLRYCLP